MEQQQPTVYRPARAASELGISKGTLYRFVKEGRLDLVKLGERSSGITVASINALLERGRTKKDEPA
jgi:excisionase family DNA binding protein